MGVDRSWASKPIENRAQDQLPREGYVRTGGVFESLETNSEPPAKSLQRLQTISSSIFYHWLQKKMEKSFDNRPRK